MTDTPHRPEHTGTPATPDALGASGTPEAADGGSPPERSPYQPAEVAEQAGTGVPDAFMRLWTPHRMAYILGENKPSGTAAGDGCPFCRIPGMTDDEGLVVRRGDSAYVVLNLYPYNPGHLMVVPFRHVADYTELTPDEVLEVAELTRQAMRVVREVADADGFNIGMNQGEIAGAGIAAHLHQHIVPRWDGDTNFMPVVAQTKVLPQLLSDTRTLLSNAWPS
jgi:ATP adenylyltransferase